MGLLSESGREGALLPLLSGLPFPFLEGHVRVQTHSLFEGHSPEEDSVEASASRLLPGRQAGPVLLALTCCWVASRPTAGSPTTPVPDQGEARPGATCPSPAG